MPKLKSIFPLFILLSLTLGYGPSAKSDNRPCPEFELLHDIQQRKFNTRVLNLMARYAKAQQSQSIRPTTGFNSKGKKAKTFEDAVQEAYFASLHDMKGASRQLARLLDIPPEIAEVAIAYYDVENHYRDHPEFRAALADRINHFFPLPDVGARVPVNGQTLTDTWSHGLQRHSPAKSQFDRWKSGEPPLANRSPGEDDGLWWMHILTPVKVIEASQAKHPTPDAGDFLNQESGRLWQLYGALVERSLLKAQKGDLIPGPAITVGGKQHADGWKVRYEKGDASPPTSH